MTRTADAIVADLRTVIRDTREVDLLLKANQEQAREIEQHAGELRRKSSALHSELQRVIEYAPAVGTVPS